MAHSTNPSPPASASPFLRDFAAVSAGYIVGHGVLRLFAGVLIGLGDKPRAALIERWIPLWNAAGFFVLAWGAYQFLRWLDRRSHVQPPSAQQRDPSATPLSPDAATPTSSSTVLHADWKARLKALQNRKDVGSIVKLQSTLATSLPKERAERLDRHLGRWYTKHFQRMMLTGRAAESADDVEQVAAYYADSEEFGYFREILPVVRQCAELKQSIAEED